VTTKIISCVIRILFFRRLQLDQQEQPSLHCVAQMLDNMVKTKNWSYRTFFLHSPILLLIVHVCYIWKKFVYTVELSCNEHSFVDHQKMFAKPWFVITVKNILISCHLGPKWDIILFVKCEFVITVIVITEFDCNKMTSVYRKKS